LGIKNIRWFPSASFPVHSHLIKYLEDGTIHHIEGSMNGPLGKFTSEGKMKGVGFYDLMAEDILFKMKYILI
jgi:citrate lyase subunit alpha/citrate CoA-transferase